jgi:flagellar biosynthesis/type III secretory pathway chaperone
MSDETEIPNERFLDGLMAVTASLCDILADENVALSAFKLDRSRDLHERKAAVARLYEHQAAQLADDPDLLNAEEREVFRETAERLRKLVDENETLLKVAIEANTNILDAFVDAARQVQQKGNVYSKSGTTARTERGTARIAIALNQTL